MDACKHNPEVALTLLCRTFVQRRPPWWGDPTNPEDVSGQAVADPIARMRAHAVPLQDYTINDMDTDSVYSAATVATTISASSSVSRRDAQGFSAPAPRPGRAITLETVPEVPGSADLEELLGCPPGDLPQSALRALMLANPTLYAQVLTARLQPIRK